MSLKLRLTIIFTSLVLALILFGLYAGTTLKQITYQTSTHRKVSAISNVILQIELDQVDYIYESDREKVNDIFDGLRAVTNFTESEDYENFSSNEQVELELINEAVKAYDRNFQTLISLNNQLNALTVDLENEIHKLNDIISFIVYEETTTTKESQALAVHLIQFYSDYATLKNNVSTIDKLTTDHLDHISETAYIIQTSPTASLDQQITALRIDNTAKNIKENVVKYIEKNKELSLTSVSLLSKAKDIQNSIDSIVESQNSSIIKEQNNVYLLMNILLFLIIVLFLSIIGYTLWYLTKNLNALLKATNKISEGDYSVRIDPIPTDEFGQLSTSINTMATSLNESFTQQKDINITLESMVAERTVELTTAKQALESLNQDLQREKEKLAYMAITDELTGLNNRRAALSFLEEQIAISMRYNRPLTIMEVDLDHFKNVNDHHGHPAGDEVLKKLAHIFIHNVREIDFVARFGGEEFLFIFPETTTEDAKDIIERIQTNVKTTPFTFANITMTFSAGVVAFSDETAIELIHKADKKLYQAKENGRDQVIY